MREILFRGKRLDNGEWVQGFYYQAKLCRSDKELCHYITTPHPECDGKPSDHIMVRPETVGEFTGLLVKGKRWFEHDIISTRSEDNEIYRFVIVSGVCGGVQNVKHTVGYVGFHFIPANKATQRCMELGARNDPLYWLNAYDCEVIGNIHDNPELLEVGEDA